MKIKGFEALDVTDASLREVWVLAKALKPSYDFYIFEDSGKCYLVMVPSKLSRRCGD